MKNLSRRDLVSSLPALALFASTLADAQQTAADPAKALPGKPSTIPPHSRTFAYDELHSSRNASGAITHSVMQGTLPTGEFIEIHETTLEPGQMPHPAHRHQHSEWLMIRQGTVTFHTETGDSVVGPGGITFARSGELHGVKNTGDTTALYFVFAVGERIPM